MPAAYRKPTRRPVRPSRPRMPPSGRRRCERRRAVVGSRPGAGAEGDSSRFRTTTAGQCWSLGSSRAARRPARRSPLRARRQDHVLPVDAGTCERSRNAGQRSTRTRSVHSASARRNPHPTELASQLTVPEAHDWVSTSSPNAARPSSADIPEHWRRLEGLSHQVAGKPAVSKSPVERHHVRRRHEVEAGTELASRHGRLQRVFHGGHDGSPRPGATSSRLGAVIRRTRRPSGAVRQAPRPDHPALGLVPSRGIRPEQLPPVFDLTPVGGTSSDGLEPRGPV